MLASNGNNEVVAPTSAPMLQIVAFPVALIVSAPGPKYSMMAPVPPVTVSSSATLRITSFGDDQPDSDPVSLTPMSLGQRTLNAWPVITSMASPPPTPMAIVPNPPALGV